MKAMLPANSRLEIRLMRYSRAPKVDMPYADRSGFAAIDEPVESISELMLGRLRTEIDRVIFAHADLMSALVPAAIDSVAFAQEMEKQLRRMRLERITFVVDLAHPGPPIRHEKPNDATRIELSFAQAQAVHQRSPLRLHKVLSKHAAEFVPIAACFAEWAPKVLDAPPYEVPEK